ncbi:hypothetical protein PG985_001400 [Apiospora marii]|uniref:uncharacterized protein n=1 Tax=Apiospora marii TaxID=335849 RepID=UPI00312D3CB9
MAPPCSESPTGGWDNASPSRNPERAGSPLDFNPDIKSADAALQRINKASGGPTCTRDDVFDCFKRIHRATEHLVDGVEYGRDQARDQDVRSEPESYSHTRGREQMQDDADLAAMINVSQDILRTLRYVQDNNTGRQQQQQHQQQLLRGTNHDQPHHYHHRQQQQQHHPAQLQYGGTSSSEPLSEPISPRQGLARGQKRKQEQQQREQQELEEEGGVGRKSKSPRAAQPAYCRHCNCTGTVKWRSGPEGLKTLCNVCGLLYAKRLRRFQRV